MTDSGISNVTTIDSLSGKTLSINIENLDSEIETIDNEDVSLLRHNNILSIYRKRKNNEYWGIILMILSTIAFSLMTLCVKISNKKYSFLQAVFTRSIFQVIAGYIGCKIIRIRPWGDTDHNFLLICRGTCSSIGMILFFAGIAYLPLADNTVVLFSGPAITSIIAWFILDEKLTRSDGLLSFTSLLGIVVIASPEFILPNNYQYNAVFYLLPFFGACMSSFAYIFIRYIGNGVHFLVHIFFSGIVSSIISGFLLFVFHSQDPILPESTFDWIIHILIAISAFIAQCFTNKGIQICTVKKRTMIRSLDVVFSFLIGISIFSEFPNWSSFIGALTIIICNIVMNLKNFEQKKREPTEVAIIISVEESQVDNLTDDDL
ncbi:hypothetical protein BCR36DRAFT_348298 [Piromyces finnis]|uniref:EamA domain-containing protein n=1 Tax=Piromyces finnis TaxID=1754191 RepID=A0A1Y1VEP4_9FUNG|nr:hypothetical protein BCR36DRAFT_348298 [Piromyces finnis]|eukprot:ORX54239.1 hypothetical protein BCR36DRAFT_348298 [Piromyces finnis]